MKIERKMKTGLSTEKGKEYTVLIFVLLVAAAICALLLDLFLDWAAAFKEDSLPPLDQKLSDFIHGFRSDSLTEVVVFLTQFGDRWVYLPVIFLAIFWLRKKGKDWKLVLPPFFILGTTTLLNMGIKRLIKRPRPDTSQRLIEVVENSLSYPSGHSMTSIAFYGFIIYLVMRYSNTSWKKWITVILMTLLIFVVGVSRVYLGVHYPTDVLAGFAAGLIWLAICIGLIEFLSLRRRKTSKPPESNLS